MATTKFESSVKLDQAVGLVMESDPKDWGAVEHMAALRYLILACSKQAKATVDTMPDGSKALMLDGKKIESIEVDWAVLKAEFSATGKLAECANFKKWLADGDYPQFKSAKERKAEFV